MNQQWNNLFHGRETPWNMLNQDETWLRNTLNQDETLFHCHETPWIRMKQCVSWSWNTLFHANETPWIRDGDHRDIDFFILIFRSWCFTALFHAVSFFFAVSCCVIAVSLMFHCCFIAVSLQFHSGFIALFHGVSRCFIALFHPVSWPWNRCSGNEPLSDDSPVWLWIIIPLLVEREFDVF